MLNYQESVGQIIEECELNVADKLQAIEELLTAKNEINKNISQIKTMAKQKKLSQL